MMTMLVGMMSVVSAVVAGAVAMSQQFGFAAVVAFGVVVLAVFSAFLGFFFFRALRVLGRFFEQEGVGKSSVAA